MSEVASCHSGACLEQYHNVTVPVLCSACAVWYCGPSRPVPVCRKQVGCLKMGCDAWVVQSHLIVHAACLALKRLDGSSLPRPVGGLIRRLAIIQHGEEGSPEQCDTARTTTETDPSHCTNSLLLLQEAARYISHNPHVPHLGGSRLDPLASCESSVSRLGRVPHQGWLSRAKE
jgi:hypothetical protein